MTDLPPGCPSIAPSLAVLAAFSLEGPENFLAQHYGTLNTTKVALRLLWTHGATRSSAEIIAEYLDRFPQWDEAGDVVVYPLATHSNEDYTRCLEAGDPDEYLKLYVTEMRSQESIWLPEKSSLGMAAADLASMAFDLECDQADCSRLVAGLRRVGKTFLFSETGPQLLQPLIHAALTKLGIVSSECAELSPVQMLKAARLKLILLLDEAQDVYVKSDDPAHASRVSLVQELNTLSQVQGVSVILAGSGYHFQPLTYRELYGMCSAHGGRNHKIVLFGDRMQLGPSLATEHPESRPSSWNPLAKGFDTKALSRLTLIENHRVPEFTMKFMRELLPAAEHSRPLDRLRLHWEKRHPQPLDTVAPLPWQQLSKAWATGGAVVYVQGSRKDREALHGHHLQIYVTGMESLRWTDEFVPNIHVYRRREYL
ncbi:hypothetical protein BDZ88DRAFT_488011 [Geranomyces variabilis]|nr:hypothetical protein BDZ88DRAFT_488011 [Geranomyces variabilis]